MPPFVLPLTLFSRVCGLHRGGLELLIGKGEVEAEFADGAKQEIPITQVILWIKQTLVKQSSTQPFIEGDGV
jgi:hypothetical protein